MEEREIGVELRGDFRNQIYFRPARAQRLTTKVLFDDLIIYPYFFTKLGSTQ